MAMSMRVTNANGRVIATKRAGVRSYHQHDALGNTIALINDSGVVTDTYTYWPYGELRTSTGTTTNPFKFCGAWGYYTDTTGRTYVRARTLRPGLTRWMTVDPLWPGEPAFSYCRCNVITTSDPSGMRESNCRERTDIYCADKILTGGWAQSCFCYVSWNVCDFVSLPCDLLSLIGPGFTIPAEICTQCQKWANCINKCLFDCYLEPKTKCSPEASACWKRVRDAMDGQPPTHPCAVARANPKNATAQRDCCKSNIFCEQTQLTYCNSKSGPCSKEDPLFPPIFVGRGIWVRTCSELMARVGPLLGFPEFPFSGSFIDRWNAGSKNCCVDKVWMKKSS